MRRHLLVAALVAAVSLSGCLGSVTPATVPQSTLDDEGWVEKDSTSDSLFLGVGSVERRNYGPPGDDFTGATVATVSDLPVIDEREQLLPRAIENVEEERGVSFEDPTSKSVQLTNMDQEAPATEYDVKGAGGPAKALVITPNCEPFVVAAGFGTTIGDRYQTAKTVVKGVQC